LPHQFDASRAPQRHPIGALGGYSVRDANDRAVAYVYFAEGFREATSGQPLSPDEGKQVAEAIARLPDHGLI